MQRILVLALAATNIVRAAHEFVQGCMVSQKCNETLVIANYD